MKSFQQITIFAVLIFSAQSFAESSPLCPNEQGYLYTNYRQRNPTQGGFVSNQAFVQDSDEVFISATAAVCGSSSVTGSSKIFGNATIINATVSGNVSIKDNAKVIGATITDNAIVAGSVYINGAEVIIRDKAQVSGNAKITGDAIIGGTAIIGGFAKIDTGVYTNEIIKPAAGKDDVPNENAEDLEREKFKKNILDQIYEARAYGPENKINVLKINSLLSEYHERVVVPDIAKIKQLLNERKNADFSKVVIIDEKIKKLNLEIGLIFPAQGESKVIVSKYLYSCKKLGLRSEAMSFNKFYLHAFFYIKVYAGSLDIERGSVI
jgi:carbonic anhydrase/acetyltransferase-like protein (isoleucine patch superfamily)